MSDANFYVYVLFRITGTPAYVGKGKGNRWARHQGLNQHPNHHLRNIVKQAQALGKELPRVKIAEHLTEDEAFEVERTVIRAVGREVNGGPLVNLTDGGDGVSGHRMSEAARAKISVAMKGRPKSPEHVAKQAAAQCGRKWTPAAEHVAHLRRIAPLAHLGHKHSEETRVKIKAARALQAALCKQPSI